MRILPGDLRSKHVYQLMVSGIVPRPIAWTGTRSAEGVDNLAPFSYFMGVSSAPPCIAISVVRQPDGSLKDTARNILDTGVFTVSLPAHAQGPEMVGSASRMPPDVSELAALDIPAVDGDVVAAPRPAEAPFAMECTLRQTLDVGHAMLIIGEVVCFHVADHARAEGRDGNPVVDTARMGALGRLGGPHYVAVEELVRIAPKTVGGELGRDALKTGAGALGRSAPKSDASALGRISPNADARGLGRDAPKRPVSELGRDAPKRPVSALGRNAPKRPASQLGRSAPKTTPAPPSGNAPK